MVVKINGRVFADQQTVQEKTQKVTDRKKTGIARVVPIATAAVAAVAIIEPSIAYASTAAVSHATSGDFVLQDAVISSIKYDMMALALLFGIKREWFKTWAIASGIVYGGFLCASTLALAVTLFFTWLNNILDHALHAMRMVG